MRHDCIAIRGLQLDTIVGVHDWERELRQTVVIDLELGVDCARAAALDRLEDAVDYVAVASWLEAELAMASYQLIETLAERLADGLLREFAVPWLRLVLHKPGAVQRAADVAIVITRGDCG